MSGVNPPPAALGINGHDVVPASSYTNFRGLSWLSCLSCLSCHPLFHQAPNQEETTPGVPETVRIARIRAELRRVEEHRFKPAFVPIGPYAEQQPPDSNPADKKGKKPLVENKTQIEKKSVVNAYFNVLLEEDQKNNPGATLAEQHDLVMQELTKLQHSAKSCYVDDLDTPEGEFVEMMMHDGIYVLNSLVKLRGSPDPACAEITLLRDVAFLLENQIPWFVLKEVQNLAGNTDQKYLRTRVRERLANGLYIREAKEDYRRTREPSHLLHLVHLYFAPTKAPQIRVDIDTRPARCTGPWKRATLYRKYAYVMFKRREFECGKVESVLDVILQGRTLLIPCLRIDDNTWTILRNLMALEEQMSEKPVTAYCVFMSQLARQADDVELLEYEGIIEQFLGNSEDVVQGFSNLCKGVIFDIDNKTNYLDDIRQRLYKRSENFGNKFMGSFMESNFGDYVQFLAFLGAIMLLLLQIAQVVIGYLSFRKQK